MRAGNYVYLNTKQPIIHTYALEAQHCRKLSICKRELVICSAHREHLASDNMKITHVFTDNRIKVLRGKNQTQHRYLHLRFLIGHFIQSILLYEICLVSYVLDALCLCVFFALSEYIVLLI